MGIFSKLIMGRDSGGYVTSEIGWASAEQSPKIKLEGGVEKTITVPPWAYRMRFIVSPGSTVWCGHGTTPLQHAADTWIYETSELNPMVRSAFDAGGNRISTLRFLAELAEGTDAEVQVIFYTNYSGEQPK